MECPVRGAHLLPSLLSCNWRCVKELYTGGLSCLGRR